jgi:pheromone shutdown protein TraB
VTLQRTWAALSLWEQVKLVAVVFYVLVVGYKISEEEVEDIKNADIMSEMMQELALSYPATTETILHERDRYLAKAYEAYHAHLGSSTY